LCIWIWTQWWLLLWQKNIFIVQSLVKNECTHIAILLMCNCFWLIPCLQEFNEIPTRVFWYGLRKGSLMN
jgi:hypothetical protein